MFWKIALGIHLALNVVIIFNSFKRKYDSLNIIELLFTLTLGWVIILAALIFSRSEKRNNKKRTTKDKKQN